MTDDTQNCFWQSIEAAPTDDLPVLIFADFLEESGDSLAAVLRECVAEGRRPGRMPGDAGAFWVTTTGQPVASRARRQGRRHVYDPVRPQPSWLAPIYYSFLSGVRGAMPNVNHGTVWHYSSIVHAYGDVLRAQAEMRKQLYDPKTGRHAFTGVTSSWRNNARRAIAVALSALPADADPKARKKAVADCYPFAERSGWAYKCFLRERRLALGLGLGPRAPRPAADVSPGACDWCDGSGCVACAATRWAKEEVAHA